MVIAVAFSLTSCAEIGSETAGSTDGSTGVVANESSDGPPESDSTPDTLMFGEEPIYVEVNPITGEPAWVNAPLQAGDIRLTKEPDGLYYAANPVEIPSTSYIPKHDAFSNRDPVVIVEGEEIDVSEYTYDSRVRDEIFGKSGGAYTIAQARYSLGRNLYESPMLNEMVRMWAQSAGDINPERVNKQYRLLDKEATDQQILDNYDLEMAAVSVTDTQRSRNGTLNLTQDYFMHDELTEVVTLRENESDTLSVNHFVLTHSTALHPDRVDNISPADWWSASRWSAGNVLAGRVIPFRTVNGDPYQASFEFRRYGSSDDPVHKWVQTGLEKHTEESFTEKFVGIEERERFSGEVADRYGLE